MYKIKESYIKFNYFHVPLWAYSLLRIIGNRVQIPNGTAAVSALCSLIVDENQSLGNWEGRERVRRIFPVSVSQKICMEKLACLCYQA